MIFSLFLLFCSLYATVHSYTCTPLTVEEKQSIGQKIWRNECAGSYEGLTTWKEGESWPSLGILHAIPKSAACFCGVWEELLDFLKKRGQKLPSLLKKNAQLPWRTRQEFNAAFHGQEMEELRKFLYSTIPLQVEFAVQRLYKKIPEMLQNLPEQRRLHVQKQFERVAESKNGMYALIDYLNFKGEGTKKQETYGNVSWGLLQVLEGMHGSLQEKSALQEFVRSAKEVLAQRVDHAPTHQKNIEMKWLQGWYKRLDTYLQD